MKYDIDKVIRARRVRGWTQAKLAKRIERASSTISGIERGSSDPSPTTMKRIADELDLDMEDLVLKERNESVRSRYRMPGRAFLSGHAKKKTQD
jgi:transcriptional regulator with XRE-family HTH domain